MKESLASPVIRCLMDPADADCSVHAHLTDTGWPFLTVRGGNLPLVWEQAVLACRRFGMDVPTQYDKPGDPPGKDCGARMIVTDPLSEPRIHRAFPGGITELETYVQEVVDGIHDHWVEPDNDDGRWKYGYHERLVHYTRGPATISPVKSSTLSSTPDSISRPLEEPAFGQNQLLRAVEQLAECPHTRRAQAIIWKPWVDPFSVEDAPCLQRLHFRVLGEEPKLHLSIYMRSNDAYKAAFMNAYAFIELQRWMAARVSDAMSRPVGIGTYAHTADSFHLYGAYQAEIDGFERLLERRSFGERTWRADDPMIIDLFTEAREQITRSIEVERETKRKGL